MLQGHKHARLAAGFTALIAPMLMGAQDLRTDLQRRVLATHNHERTQLGVPPLRWNHSLEASAAEWAEYLASTGRFEHAPENPNAPQGENLWAGARGRFTPEAMTAAWIREKQHFQPGPFPHNSKTGRVEDVGHYTQLVWRSTRAVGCAMASSQQEDILVCRYSDAGNYRGQRPY